MTTAALAAPPANPWPARLLWLALLAATLTLLAFSGRLSPLWVFVVAVPGGIVRPNDQVLRNILVGETMPPAQLMGALGLSRATMDSARVVGSLAGAGIFAALGFGAAYVLVVALYAGSLLLTLGMSQRRPVAVPVGEQPASADAAAGVSGLRDLVEGLLHVWRSPALVSALWLAFLINLTAYPISGGLLAYIAREIYHTDATGLGRLAASFSLGALVGIAAELHAPMVLKPWSVRSVMIESAQRSTLPPNWLGTGL